MTEKIQILFNLSFLAIIVAFGIYGLVSLQKNSSNWLETRGTIPPHRAFSNVFDQQFSENPRYIKPLAEAKFALFDKAITPKVLPGKDGWLFLGQENERINTVTQSLGLDLLSPNQLKHWKLLFEQRQTWCEANGIEFWLIIAPNKATFYKNKLPGRLNIFFTTTMTDQLFEALRGGFPVIGLNSHLNILRPDQGLFHKTDTHWNDRGAWIAANGILRELVPDTLLTNPLSAFSVKDTIKKTGDLARMMLMEDKWDENEQKFEFKDSTLYQTKPEKEKIFPDYLSAEVTAAPTGSLPKTQLFHDSFGEMLKPFLSPHFEEIQYFRLWKGFEPYWIKKEQPEIVLNLIVERLLMSHNTHNDPFLIQHYWPDHFAGLNKLDLPNSLEKFEDLTRITKGIKDLPDAIMVLRLTVENPGTGKLSIDYGYQQLNYELIGGQNELYLQVLPGQHIDFTFSDGHSPSITKVEWRYF